MSNSFTQGIVRILDENGIVAGTGFVLSTSGLIATCSHVVQHESLQQLGTPASEMVTVVFHATGEMQHAMVKPEWWLAWDAGDLAILQIEGLLPQGVQPLPLGSAQGTNDHEISTFGFPQVDAIEGLGGSGTVICIVEEAGKPIIQLRSSEITGGFSGAPIWDKLGQRVIGMVSSVTQRDPLHRLGQTAFALTTETLLEVCPLLHVSEICPYRGLASFTEVESQFFFGREQIIKRLLDRLRADPRFLLVLGPSGSGKSSVVQAGLIPQLRNGQVPDSDHWGIILMRPASQPFDEFVKQGVFTKEHNLTENVRLWLQENPEHTRLMLVIDQFEELLSICPEGIRRDFLADLVNLLHAPLPISIVLIMRDDFYSRFTQQEGLLDWLKQDPRPFHVPRYLKQDELSDIIKKPIEAMGLSMEEGLIDVIINDTLEEEISEESGQVGRTVVLPLLSFALTELWKRRRDSRLTHIAYRMIGGVAGALPQWADRSFNDLEPDERQVAQQLLTSLVYIGDKNQGILDSRRRRTLSSLCRIEDKPEAIEHVVHHFVAARLLATGWGNKEETVEIIHDVLLRKWGKLQSWLEEDRRFLTWHQELDKLIQIWAIRRNKSRLLRGSDLAEAERWLKKRRTHFNQGELTFLHASKSERQRSRVSKILLSLVLIFSSFGVWQFFLRPPDPSLVTTLEDSAGIGSLRWCIANAPTKSTIRFAPSLHGSLKINLGNLEFPGGKQLTIEGHGPDMLSISQGEKPYSIIIHNTAIITFIHLSFKDNKLRQVPDPSSFQLALIKNEGTLNLTESMFADNIVAAHNIASTLISNSGTTSIAKSSFLRNFSDSGSIIDNRGTITITTSTFSQNSSRTAGAVISNERSMTVIGSVFSENASQSSAGAIINRGIASITGSTFVSNSSNQSGGAITNASRLSIQDSLFTDNKADDSAGAIYNNLGDLSISNSTLMKNQSLTSGGAIKNDASLFISNSTLFANMSRSGGAIATETGLSQGGFLSNATITFCTIFRNHAALDAGGISIHFLPSPLSPTLVKPLIITYTLVAANTASKYSDVALRQDPTVDQSTTSFSAEQSTTWEDNLITNSDGIKALIPKVQSLEISALKIAPTPAIHGGVTPTLALSEGSLAIDAIPSKNCHTRVDQRGISRPQGNGCDIGAYEYP